MRTQKSCSSQHSTCLGTEAATASHRKQNVTKKVNEVLQMLYKRVRIGTNTGLDGRIM